MSVFEAISIQGIRSFDPNKAQVLEFFKPVTIILGQNGSGKTTIIESLKYATTGDFPPGAKMGGSFVHDPKLAQETEIKAKISLSIKDLKGNSLNVSRCLKATQKDRNKQVTLQTLDSSIKRVLSNGECVSLSSKCSDINLEMTNSLGVSKAVLENVIFCHQEDSNWPLMEGKCVKERFDNLFASTRYVKALDSIRKTKMEKETEIKQCKTELKYLKVNRDEAEKKLSDKKVLESNLADISLKIDDIKEKLDPTETSIHIYQHQINQLSQIESEMKIKINEKSSHQRRIEELSQNISEPLNYSAGELDTMINDSAQELERMKKEINDIEFQINDLKSANSKLHNLSNSLLIEKGGLNTKIEAHKIRHEKFNIRLQQVSSDLHIDYNPSSATRTIANFQDNVANEEELLNDKLKIEDQEIKNKQCLLDEKIVEKTKLEHAIEMSRTNLKKKQIELKILEKRIADIGEDSNKLASIDEDVSNLKEELTIFNENFDSKNVKENVEIHCSDITCLEDSLQKTDNELSTILKLEAKFSEINSLRQQITEKSTEAKRLRSRHSEYLITLFDNDIPKSNIKKLLNDKLIDWRTKSHQCQNDCAKWQSQLAKYNSDEQHFRTDIEEKKELVRKYEERVFKLCGNSEFDQVLSKLKKRKLELEEEMATAQGNVSLYKKFKTILTTNGSDCPLCHREFCNQSETDSLIEEINDKINFAPDLEKKSKELEGINDEFEDLLKLESQSREIITLKDSINNLERDVQVKRADICNAKSLIEKVSSEHDSYKKLEDIGNMIQVDVAMMEKLTEDSKDFEKNLFNLEGQIKISEEEFRETVSKLQSTKSALQNELINKKKVLVELRQNYEKSMNTENELKSKMNNLERKKLEIQAGQQEFSSLTLKKADLQTEVISNEESIKSSTFALEPIIRQVSLIRNDLANMQQQRKLIETESKEKINVLKLQIRDLSSILSDIKRFEKENVQEVLNDLEKRIMKNTNIMAQNSECISEMEETIERDKSRISNHKIKSREMVDTLAIRQCQSAIAQLEQTINILTHKIGESDLTKMQMELVNLENSKILLKKEFDDCNYNKCKAVNQINFIEEECRQRYFNAEPIYIAMLTKMKVTEIAVCDLDKYYKAMDQAIMSHHRTKMTEINKLLKELWMNTYSGKDIDYVEICSDEETTSAGSKRRNYNYRVVMLKSGVRLDMRGRCSAGQKVLASLLIRLALAEVFCLHCGVISLDEPTTNLDQENIENLAYALIKIIKNRSKQKNFQLILITHDEEFLEQLSKSDYVDEFYKIYCNTKGHSEVMKTRIEHR